MSELIEKRHFQRIAHDAKSTVSDGEQLFTGHVLDLSLKGCLLQFDAEPELAAGRIYRIGIRLSEEIVIAMEAELIHTRAGRAGFRCRQIDLDSVCALRRLVELNLGDPELLEREIEALAQSAA